MGYSVHCVARTASVYDDIVVKLPIVLEPKDESAVEASLEEVIIVSNEDEENENDDENEENKENDEDNESDEGKKNDNDENDDETKEKNDNEDGYSCADCDKTFKNRGDLMKHRKDAQ